MQSFSINWSPFRELMQSFTSVLQNNDLNSSLDLCYICKAVNTIQRVVESDYLCHNNAVMKMMIYLKQKFQYKKSTVWNKEIFN